MYCTLTREDIKRIIAEAIFQLQPIIENKQ